MKINEIIVSEIELIGGVEFPKDQAQQRLSISSPYGKFNDELYVYFLSDGDVRIVTLADDEEHVAALASFISKNNDSIWQAKNIATYHPYKNQKLAANLYKYIKTQFRKSLQSDYEQTVSGAKLWTKDLPSVGLFPMIYDHATDRIIDPEKQKINMYPPIDSEDTLRYSWILEKNDFYSAQNLIENPLLLPLTSKWKK
jgi:hypothetical protein